MELNTTKKQVEIALLLTKVENPNRSAACLAEFIVEQLEKRVPFRRVLKRSIQKAEEASVEGIKVQISGRLNGAEIARSERIHKGQVPLHTLRAKIEYNSRTAKTIYGLLGVKVWVFNGFADSNEIKLLNLNEVLPENSSVPSFSGAIKT
ncbi:30S ribosomal protein S3 [bacterium]|nr:MAG: 30S ribosomal protein S3 [bacterium]